MQTGFSVAHGAGWYPQERDGQQGFRWMGGRARAEIKASAVCRSAWLRLACGLWGASAEAPELAVTVNGRNAGPCRVSRHLGYRAFKLGAGDRFDVEFTLDRTFSCPGDDRTLGLMVQAIDLLDEHELATQFELDGWYPREDHEYFPFCWMGREARSLVPAMATAGARFAAIPVAASVDGDTQILHVSCGERPVAELPLLRGWHIYDVELQPDSPGEHGGDRSPLLLSFRLNTLCPRDAHPQDPRSLGVRVGPIEVHGDRRRRRYAQSFHEARRSAETPAGAASSRASSEDTGAVCCGLPTVGNGWNGEERDERGPFRWMKHEASLRIPAHVRGGRGYCALPMFSAYRNLTQHVFVLSGGRQIARFDLVKGWNDYSVVLPPGNGEETDLTLRVNKLTPAGSHSGDPRELGVRVGWLTLHGDLVRHERDVFLVENAARNQREMQEGATTLTSFPQTLGIDLYGKCNIKPACVYCLWDRTKVLEGEAVNTVVDERALEGYGRLFDAARLLVNCSFGEPLLHPRLDHVLDLAASHGKVMELSSNGQAFTARNVRALAGRQVHLFVSLDAATAATYARLRNDRWDEIIAALLFLRDARRAGGGWPRLNLVFMPLRANLADMEQYFRLCRMVDADTLVLRPLLYLERPGIVTERGGYRFEYERELLTRAELEPVFAACEGYSVKYNVRVTSQFDFGLVDASRFQDTLPMKGDS